MADEAEQFSYFVYVAKVPDVIRLQWAFDQLGDASWELVTSVTTVKTWMNVSGNDLVFVFKKRGPGHKPPAGILVSFPTTEQVDYLHQLLASKGMDATEVESVDVELKRGGSHWSDVALDSLNRTLYPMTLAETRSHLEGLASG